MNRSFDGYSSDVDPREKSKEETSFAFTPAQLAEMENQLVMKIMKHFKDQYKYPPTHSSNDDVFYSPIGEKILGLIFHQTLTVIESSKKLSQKLSRSFSYLHHCMLDFTFEFIQNFVLLFRITARKRLQL